MEENIFTEKIIAASMRFCHYKGKRFGLINIWLVHTFGRQKRFKDVETKVLTVERGQEDGILDSTQQIEQMGQLSTDYIGCFRRGVTNIILTRPDITLGYKKRSLCVADISVISYIHTVRLGTIKETVPVALKRLVTSCLIYWEIKSIGCLGAEHSLLERVQH